MLRVLPLPLLRLVRGISVALLRFRSISPVTLELLGYGADSARQIDTPSQILECCPHGFVETVRILSLDYGLQLLAYFGTVSNQLDGIFVIDQLFLVGL